MNKIVKVKGSTVSYYYDGTLHWIPDSETYLCLVGRDGRKVMKLNSQGEANSLGNGKLSRPGSCRGSVIWLTSS
jgi:hypothetical protein